MKNWRTIDKSVEARLEAILRSWEGTPYLPGQQKERVGVDCVRFVCAVLDDVRGTPRTPIETLPQDAAMHNRTSAILAMKKINALYRPNVQAFSRLDTPLEEVVVEPGDVVVCAPEGGGPGHVMLAGARPYELWESSGTGVRRVGLGGLLLDRGQWRLHYVYRITNKQEWSRG